MKDIFLIYGISDCPSCLHACADLMEVYPHCEYVFINTDFSPAHREIVKQRHNMSTFPIILCNDILIGGYDELSNFLTTERKYGVYSSPELNKKTEPS